MSDYNENFENGELWLRYPSGVIYPATSALSSLYLKYSPIDSKFYQELKNNEVLKFDVFYDTVFIETQSGHIFDKIVFEDNAFVPYSLDNRFFNTKKPYIFVDHWLDEKNKKIYTTINQYNFSSISAVNIGIMMEQFDIVRNTFNMKLFYEVNINFGSNIFNKTPILEPAKMTYSVDTKKFNISFIIRGPNNQFGLISTNISKYDVLTPEETNCFIPYSSAAQVFVNILEQNLLETDYYS